MKCAAGEIPGRAPDVRERHAPCPPDEANGLSIARTHRLSVNHAGGLELAQREALPLVTPDTVLARAAQAEKVSLLRTPGT
ncbi:MAG: hypothetical protein ACREFV_02215 [Acetobacteraceae bacterium]